MYDGAFLGYMHECLLNEIIDYINHQERDVDMASAAAAVGVSYGSLTESDIEYIVKHTGGWA